MSEERMMSESKPLLEMGSQTGPDEESLLAVVLAAALVEYRQQASRRNGNTTPAGAATNWRMMTRLEQLAQAVPDRPAE
jgi:hypothetical protein